MAPCGEYMIDSKPGGFSGYTHYFLDGEHVATHVYSDTNIYCGGFGFWYGKRVDCVPDEASDSADRRR